MSSIDNLSPASQAYLQNKSNKNTDAIQTTPAPEPKKNGKTKLVLALAALGTAAIAGIAIYKNKKPADVVETAVKSLDDNKALRKSGEALEETFKGSVKKELNVPDAQEVVKKSENTSKKLADVENKLQPDEVVLNKASVEDKAAKIDKEIDMAPSVPQKPSVQEEIVKASDEINAAPQKVVKNELEVLREKADGLKKEANELCKKNPNTDTAEGIAALEKKVEYLEAELEFTKNNPDAFKFEIREAQEKLNIEKNILEKYKKDFEKTQKFNAKCAELIETFGNDDAKLQQTYKNATLGKIEMDKEDYEALKKIYADKFETLPEISQNSQVSCHHHLNGQNMNYRRAAKKGEIDDLVSDIDKEFENLPPLNNDITVYRGRAKHCLESFNADFNIVKNAKPGDVIIPDTAYSYTAPHRSLAEHWAQGFDTENMVYEIKIPKGAKVSANLEHGGEVVMPRGAQYKVIDKGVAPDGILNVILEYILP